MTRPSPRERAFAEHLRALAGREDSGARAALAALRRGLGKEPGEVAEVAQHVMPWIVESDRPETVAAYFQVAALFASHRLAWADGERSRMTNLGASFRRLVGNDENPGAERRFVALLNAHTDELDRHLRHAVSLLKSQDSPVPIDWAQLLRDIQEWTYEDRHVQQAWARAFWGSGRASEDGAESPEGPAALATSGPESEPSAIPAPI